MTHAKFKPNNREDRIARLIEECGEVLQQVGKIGRFGLDTRYDKKWKRVITLDHSVVESNREGLLREMGDLAETITALDADLRENMCDA